MSEFDTNDDRVEEVPLVPENAEGNATEPLPKPKKSSFTKELVDYIEMLVSVFLITIVIFSFCFRLCTVKGPSMEKTLIDGERVIISDLFYEPKYGDIVVFHDTDTLNEPVVKRVIAVSGEKVKITYTLKDMTVEVTHNDGSTEKLSETYIQYDFSQLPYNYKNSEYTVPEGMLFVMGDNRSHSMDSRDPRIEFVDERSVLGKVILRITPFSKIGIVK